MWHPSLLLLGLHALIARPDDQCKQSGDQSSIARQVLNPDFWCEYHRGHGHPCQAVDRVREISDKTLVEHIKRGIPIVLEQAFEPPRWNESYLIKKIGNHTVSVEVNPPHMRVFNYGNESKAQVVNISMSDFITKAFSGSTAGGLQYAAQEEVPPGLYGDINPTRSFRMARSIPQEMNCLWKPNGRLQMFMGSGGQVHVAHADSPISFAGMFAGNKTWMIFPPKDAHVFELRSAGVNAAPIR